jgi:hypothetical protein
MQLTVLPSTGCKFLNMYFTPAAADAVLQVCAGNVAWLLDMASYLEVQPLQEACCEVRCSISVMSSSLRRAPAE